MRLYWLGKVKAEQPFLTLVIGFVASVGWQHRLLNRIFNSFILLSFVRRTRLLAGLLIIAAMAVVMALAARTVLDLMNESQRTAQAIDRAR